MLLRKGSRGDDVKRLQEALGIAVDGTFGADTETAVKNWQKSHGLGADGIVGRLTWGKLFEVGNFAELDQGDIDDDNDPDVANDPDTASDANFGDIDGLKLNQLKGHVPDTVIAQIPQCLADFRINTRLRLAHFLAQCGHESMGFKVTAENLNYSAQGLKKPSRNIFPATWPTAMPASRKRSPRACMPTGWTMATRQAKTAGSIAGVVISN
jgi:putative chitinase